MMKRTVNLERRDGAFFACFNLIAGAMMGIALATTESPLTFWIEVFCLAIAAFGQVMILFSALAGIRRDRYLADLHRRMDEATNREFRNRQ